MLVQVYRHSQMFIVFWSAIDERYIFRRIEKNTMHLDLHKNEP